MGAPSNSEQPEKLITWKEIAAFLGKDVRTARRWNAKRGLPVHRVPGGKGASVFAYTSELEAWLRTSSRSELPEERVSADSPSLFSPPHGTPIVAAPPAKAGRLGTTPLRLGILAVLVGALFAGAYIAERPQAPKAGAAPQPQRIMLAVLPFINLSGDPQQEYFSDGMTEELITVLGGMNPRQLGVIARTSAMGYKGSAKSVREIGKELRVDYVLEGSVERAGQRIRVTAQLIQVSDQTHMWAATYDRDPKNLLTFENEAADAIAAEIRISLQPKAKTRLVQLRSVNPDAYEAYLKGRFYWNKRNNNASETARAYFREAIQADPGFAAAYAGLADSYFGGPDAEAAARRAVELDDTLSEAHASLGFCKFFNDWDAASAEAEFQRAIELDPNYVTAHHWYALLLSETGRPRQAIAEINIARQLDPLSVVVNTDAGMILYWARENDEAVGQLHKALELDPNFDWAHFWLGRAYEQKGMYDQAIAHFEIARDLPNSLMDKTAALGHAYAAMGRREQALQVIETLRRRSGREEVSPVNLAEIYTALGHKDQAFQELDAAYKAHNAWLLALRAEPNFDPLRGDPRCQDLLRRSQIPRPLTSARLIETPN